MLPHPVRNRPERDEIEGGKWRKRFCKKINPKSKKWKHRIADRSYCMILLLLKLNYGCCWFCWSCSCMRRDHLNTNSFGLFHKFAGVKAKPKLFTPNPISAKLLTDLSWLSSVRGLFGGNHSHGNPSHWLINLTPQKNLSATSWLVSLICWFKKCCMGAV